MKLGKSLYFGCRSYSQGGAKARGDSVTLLMMILWFFAAWRIKSEARQIMEPALKKYMAPSLQL